MSTAVTDPGPQRLSDTIYAALREAVLTCRLWPGSELREQGLAQEFAVSKSPVREALARLERDGLVAVTPRRGYRVTPVSLVDARDLLGLRQVLEPACAAAAARAGGAEALAALDAFRDGPADPSPHRFVVYNRAFHCALADACDNRRLALATRRAVEEHDRLVLISIGGLRARDPSALVAEHAGIVDAVQARDGRRAARLVRGHLAAAEKRIIGALERAAVVP